jgi:hypothetical protein
MSGASSKSGYGKPPVASQFKPGQSGNSGGRPKGSKNLRTLIKEAARAKVVVNEGGRKRKRSKMDLVVTQMMNKAAQGEARFVTMALDQVHCVESEAKGSRSVDFAEPDRLVIEQILQRLHRCFNDT